MMLVFMTYISVLQFYCPCIGFAFWFIDSNSAERVCFLQSCKNSGYHDTRCFTIASYTVIIHLKDFR